jgi:hypothetical protein
MANFNLADYETVDERIKRFYADHPNGRINTELVAYDGEIGHTRWVVKAMVWRDSGYDAPDGVDYAFEVDGAGMAQKTAALETCATSAIGRALADIGYSGSKRASREEMQKGERQARPAADKPSGGLDAAWAKRVADAKSYPELTALYDEAKAAGWDNSALADLRQACANRKSEAGWV